MATREILTHPLENGLAALADARLRIDPLGKHERQRIIAGLFPEGKRRKPFLHRFYSLMTLSVLIAVFGVLADSTAVVIGAMLVAPLMAPVLGIAAAAVMDWTRRAAWATWVTLTGTVLAIALAAAVSWLLPGDPQPLPNELLARTSPRLVDLGVALAAGSAGAYSQVRRQAGDAIVGVAVAVALIPPLAVIGITLQIGEWQMAFGAFLLFLANVIGMITAGERSTFIVFGLVPNGRLFETRQPIARRLRMTVMTMVLVVAPLQIIDEWRPTPGNEFGSGQAMVAEAVGGWRADARIISMAIEDLVEKSEPPTVHLTIASSANRDEPLGVDLFAERISDAFGSSVNVVVTSVESNVESATSILDESETTDNLSPIEAERRVMHRIPLATLPWQKTEPRLELHSATINVVLPNRLGDLPWMLRSRRPWPSSTRAIRSASSTTLGAPGPAHQTFSHLNVPYLVTSTSAAPATTGLLFVEPRFHR